MKDPFDEPTIQDRLWGHLYGKGRTWIAPNVYCFEWESDILAVMKSGRTEEYEIKCSRSDFLADQKKIEKMEALTTGIITRTVCRGKERIPIGQDKVRRPNRFFYVTTEGIVTADDIPHFAGWIELRHDGTSTIISPKKKAPLLHTEKLPPGTLTRIGRSMMYRHWDNRRVITRLQRRIEELKSDQKEKT